MTTQYMQADAASIAQAASILCAGGLVAFPTETVYGLGADALNPAAVARIFEAKGRPADNPLIAHIADIGMLDALVGGEIDSGTRRLMDAFWPGPLTLLFRRGDGVPDVLSAGLATVAVRMPSHPVAQALIRAAKTPIAAPSANRSGRPSPTTAAHVRADMQGRIDCILDGGACGIGVESTVVDSTGDAPIVLRPGGVTLEALRAVAPSVRVDPAVLSPLAQGQQARSPGMKHRHYAPRAQVVVVRGDGAAVARDIRARCEQARGEGRRVTILCAQDRAACYPGLPVCVLGSTAEEMARGLFDALRAADEAGVDLILAEATQTAGMGLALMNRLLRAADFDVMDAT